MTQMKEQNKTPEKEWNKMETSNLLDAEFKTLVIRMLNELSENLNSIKKDKSEMIVLALMNTIHGINSGVDEAGDEVKDLEVKKEENNQNSKKKKESKK